LQIHLISVGRRMPDWVVAGYEEYARRLPHECALRLTEIEPARRTRNAIDERIRAEEGERLLRAVPKGAGVIVLDERGERWSTEALARRLGGWLGEGRDQAMLVGGPDGLAPQVLARADLRWSLSPLTFPHPLVRVVVAEQIYRAWTLLRGHPYHRG